VLKLFPNYQFLKEYEKVGELIDGIATTYESHPTIAMSAFRSLIEILVAIFLKEFFDKGEYDQKSDKGVHHKIENIFDLYRTPGVVCSNIVDQYKDKLTKRNKKQLSNYYVEQLDPNSYVHDPVALASSSEVFTGLRKYHVFLNLILDSVIEKQKER
jgi:hypothetical protein